jgi:hypothetical protein
VDSGERLDCCEKVRWKGLRSVGRGLEGGVEMVDDVAEDVLEGGFGVGWKTVCVGLWSLLSGGVSWAEDVLECVLEGGGVSWLRSGSTNVWVVSWSLMSVGVSAAEILRRLLLVSSRVPISVIDNR